MNILFISPHRLSCSWGNSARNYIRALHSTGVNLTIRPLYSGPSIETTVDPLFEELEKTHYDKYDAVIQNVLPNYLVKNTEFGKNIALFYTESAGWTNGWQSNLSYMDDIWCPSSADMWNIYHSFDKKYTYSNIDQPPTYNVPIPFNSDEMDDYDQGAMDGLSELKGSFNFYFIGEYTERKNVKALIRAFHTEFDPSENVNLVIKTHIQGQRSHDVEYIVRSDIDAIKQSLRLYPIEQYIQEHVILDFLPKAAVNAIHRTCQCLVMPSLGESWCIPIVEALYFNNSVITTANTGPEDIINNMSKPNEIRNSTILSHLDKMHIRNPPMANLFNGREICHYPVIYDLCKKMRFRYQQWLDNKKPDTVDVKNIYSYKAIGERMVERIEFLLGEKQ